MESEGAIFGRREGVEKESKERGILWKLAKFSHDVRYNLLLVFSNISIS